ncbi:probable NAP1-related protein 1 [Coccomyxa sp. Obi]|nr:probable NAP1-related protein 1 [Coccomyxa sp. Obi]
MSAAKRSKAEAASTEPPEEEEASLRADEEEGPLENGADDGGDLEGAAGEEAAADEYEYEAAENDFLSALEEVQEKLIEVNEEASDKVLQVEQEYNVKRQPIYKERNQVISQMPDFWHMVFRGHDTLRPIITAEDEEGLAHLVEILVEEAPDIKSGFKIVFTFLENHFFQNTVLEKDIRYHEDGSYEIKTIGPQWQPGQSLTEVAVYEGGKPTGKKRKRDALSFFSWLEGSMPEDSQVEIAEIIKEQIWPNPLLYYQQAMMPSVEGPIELLDDEEEEEYDEEAHEMYDEHGNQIQGEYVEVQEGGYVEGADAGEYYEEEGLASYEGAEDDVSPELRDEGEEYADAEGEEGDEQAAEEEEAAAAAAPT